MEKNRIIIVALIVIIVALLAGILLSLPNFSKIDSHLEVLGEDTLVESSNLQIKLTDANGTALSNQSVKITFTDNDSSTSDYSVVTDEEGIGVLKLDKNAGDYDVTAVYGGNDGYNGCNVTKRITVEKEAVEASSSTVSDPGAFYSAQSERVIYTGEVQDAPDGHKWKHLGNNEWVRID